ncbi:MAG TPA: class I SAM-dependent methyltransferase [Gaiellaceae bacterium]
MSAEQAKSFQRVAEAYERGRPGWPPELLDVVPVPDDATVLDLAAGTGKLTRVLAARYARVVAVEPLSELRAILAELVPQAEALPGVAEAIPLDEASVDAVFTGQAFHWFANEVAVAEIARVLRPGGVFARFWNESAEPDPLPPAYLKRLEELHDAMPPPDIDEHVFDGTPFGEVHVGVLEHEHVSSRDEVLAFAASVSWIANREDRDEVLAGLASLLPEGEYRFLVHANYEWAHRT